MRIDHYVHFDDEVLKLLHKNGAKLDKILQNMEIEMSDFDDIKAQAQANEDAEDAAAVAIQALALKLDQALQNGNIAGAKDLIADMRTHAAALSAAIVATSGTTTTTPTPDPTQPAGGGTPAA